MLQATGFTANYTDPSSGQNLPEAWININAVLYRPYDYVLIVVDIYVNQASYQSGMQPVFANIQKQINESSPDWMTYFDPDTMDAALHNIQRQVISWLQANISNLKR